MENKIERISVQLSAVAFERKCEPLGDVLDKATRVVSGGETGRFSMKRYIVRQAIRAVCEAIIRDGQVAMPIAVTLDNPALRPTVELEAMQQDEWGSLDGVRAPGVFSKLAEYYKQDPDELATMLVHRFCLNPPRKLIVVSREAPLSGPESDSISPSHSRK